MASGRWTPLTVLVLPAMSITATSDETVSVDEQLHKQELQLSSHTKGYQEGHPKPVEYIKNVRVRTRTASQNLLVDLSNPNQTPAVQAGTVLFVAPSAGSRQWSTRKTALATMTISVFSRSSRQ